MHREPLPGPLDVDPAGEVANLQTARLQLGEALTGIDLGAHDRQVIAWLTGTDVSRIATVASLLRRATVAGLTAGRAGQVGEIPVIALLQNQVAALMEAKDADRAEADDAFAEVKALARKLEEARATLKRVNSWWRDAQAERDEARSDVDDLEAELRDARADCARVVDGLRTAAEALQHEAVAERDRLQASLAEARAEALAGDHDRNALTRILAAAADVSVRFDAEKVSAQGAFERVLAVIADAGGAPVGGQGRPTVADHWQAVLVALRRDAEVRLGVPSPGTRSVCEDPVYGAALDAWQAWRDAQAKSSQARTDEGSLDEYWAPHNHRRCPGCNQEQHRLRRGYPWFHAETGRVECAAAAELLDDPCAVEPGGDR